MKWVAPPFSRFWREGGQLQKSISTENDPFVWGVSHPVPAKGAGTRVGQPAGVIEGDTRPIRWGYTWLFG